MSAVAAGEPGLNSTAATSDFIIYPWHPADTNQLHGTQGIIWCPPEYPPEEKPKRKSKWLLKQMKRRGHQGK
ncbi:hypothetical protein LCGC14_0726750 [marine sediment metagenome]|uniref:Uncharacterized protein n=1 Tax=marine sediment metagenome TaxID=412755 RepID=A0A0F9QF07_9ZZZZ